MGLPGSGLDLGLPALERRLLVRPQPLPGTLVLPAAFYKLTDSRSQITSYVFDEVRATVPRMPLDSVFTGGCW